VSFLLTGTRVCIPHNQIQILVSSYGQSRTQRILPRCARLLL
jgi:hypothetical protein